MKPPIWFSLILAIQELSCLLFFLSLYFMQNIPISKTLFVITQLVWPEVSLVRSRRPTFVSPEPWPSGSTLSYPCPTYLSYLSYPISFPWNSIFGWRPLIRTRYTMWQSLVTKNRKSKKLFIKIWFFYIFSSQFCQSALLSDPGKSIARTFRVYLVFDRILRSEPRFEFRRQFRLYVSTWKTDP